MCAHVRPASEDGRPAACDGGQDPALDMPAQAAPWHGYTGRSLLNINIFEYIWFIYIYIHVNRYTQKINTIPFYRFQIRRRSWDDLGIFRVCVHWVWSFCRSRLSPGLFVGNAVGAGAEMVGNTPPTTQKASKNNKSKGCFFHSIPLLKILHLDHFQGPQRGDPRKATWPGFWCVPGIWGRKACSMRWRTRSSFGHASSGCTLAWLYR